MTSQQRRFCIAYLSNGFKAVDAARTAGYTDKSLSNHTNKIINRPAVKYFLRKKIAEMSIKEDLNIEWKFKKLKKAVDVTIPDDGECDPSEMSVGLKAIDILNKMQGDYAPINVNQANLNANVEIDEEKAAVLLKEFEKEY